MSSSVALLLFAVALGGPPTPSSAAGVENAGVADSAGTSATRIRAFWEQNARAAPAWAEGASRAAPQLLGPPDVARTFHAGALTAASLSCSLKMRRERGWDVLRGKVDLDVRLSFGLDDTAGVTLQGPEDEGHINFSVPGVHLREGEKVKLSAADRDFSGADWVGAVVLRYDGTFPMRFVHRRFVARCAIADPAEPAVAAQELDAALGRLARALKPDAAAEDFGFPEREDRAVRRLIEDLAARRGWADDAVVDAGGRYTSTLERWNERAVKAVGRLLSSNAHSARPLHTAIDLDTPRVTCGESARQDPALTEGIARPCVLDAHVQLREGGVVLQTAGVTGDVIARRLAVVTLRGRVTRPSVGSYELDGGTGPKFRLRLRRNDGAKARWLVGLRGGEQAAALRVQVGRRRFVWLPLMTAP